MEKSINKKQNKLFKLNTMIIFTSIITFVLGVADLVLDILHTKGSAIATAFLILGIVMSIPALIWLISCIILIVNDKKNEIINPRRKIYMIVVMSISFCAFVPLWIEGFIDGNAMPMFNRAIYRQVIWMIVWIIYLLTNLDMFTISFTNRRNYLQSK